MAPIGDTVSNQGPRCLQGHLNVGFGPSAAIPLRAASSRKKYRGKAQIGDDPDITDDSVGRKIGDRPQAQLGVPKPCFQFLTFSR